jgi:hypothetical protein
MADTLFQMAMSRRTAKMWVTQVNALAGKRYLAMAAYQYRLAVPLLASLAVLNGARLPGPYTLAVLVADGNSGALLADAEVRIPARKLAERSDSAGEARFRALAPGIVRVTALHPGYSPIETEAVLGVHDSTLVVFLMEPTSHVLDTIHVRAPAPPEYLRDFETRRRMGLGRFLTEVQLDSTKHEKVADLIARRFPGLRAEWTYMPPGVKLARPGYFSVSPAQAPGRPAIACEAQLYIDEIRASPDMLWSVQAGDVAAVEYYSSAPPVRYYRPGYACGVVLLWTKR